MTTTRLLRSSARAAAPAAAASPGDDNTRIELKEKRVAPAPIGDAEDLVSDLSDLSDSGSERTVVAVVKKKRKVSKASTGAPVPSEPPANWDVVYKAVRAYRQQHKAPVDDMGCERLGDKTIEPKIYRFQTLVALMLSAQTKDTVTGPVMMDLRDRGLCCEKVMEWSEDELDGYIRKVGFHRRKAYYIKQTAKILQDQYGGDIPSTLEGLMALPGVGPKMSFLALQCAWGINAGIGVDVHVHRISNRLKWVHTQNPEDTRRVRLPLGRFACIFFAGF
ncbi:alpha,alpha-trehalase nth1 [Sorochytrium milnesiophthora]